MAGAPAGRPFNICSGRAWKIARPARRTAARRARADQGRTWIEARLRPSDVPVVQGDASRIRSELGWAPKIRVEQMLSDTLEWWRGSGAAATRD